MKSWRSEQASHHLLAVMTSRNHPTGTRLPALVPPARFLELWEHLWPVGRYCLDAPCRYSLVAGPFELTKIGRQLSTDIVKLQGCRVEPAEQAIRQSYYGKTTWQTMRAIARNRGVFGLYSGFRLHLVRDIIGTSIWFAGYETLKQEISYLRGSPPNNALPVSVASFLSGCLSLLVVCSRSPAVQCFEILTHPS